MIYDLTHKKFLLIVNYTSYFGHEQLSMHKSLFYLCLCGSVLSYFLTYSQWFMT